MTCRFHGNAGWRWIRGNDGGWTEAIEFDKAIRYGYPHATTQGQQLRGQYFSNAPADRSTKSTCLRTLCGGELAWFGPRGQQ